MSILVNKKTRLVVQGITGGEGTFHSSQMLAYGTNVAAGVTPGKGGTVYKGNEKDQFKSEVPVFNTVAEAVMGEGVDTSVIFVPAAFAADAVMEAADAGIGLIVCITEGIPTKDMIRVYEYVKQKGSRLIGPNCPGIITPGECKVGIMPGFIHKTGARWACVAQWNTHVRSCVAAYRARYRPIDVYRNRRRSDYRDTFHRCDPSL